MNGGGGHTEEEMAPEDSLLLNRKLLTQENWNCFFFSISSSRQLAAFLFQHSPTFSTVCNQLKLFFLTLANQHSLLEYCCWNCFCLSVFVLIFCREAAVDVVVSVSSTGQLLLTKGFKPIAAFNGGGKDEGFAYIARIGIHWIGSQPSSYSSSSCQSKLFICYAYACIRLRGSVKKNP